MFLNIICLFYSRKVLKPIKSWNSHQVNKSFSLFLAFELRKSCRKWAKRSRFFSFNHFSRQLETGFLFFRVVRESLFFISFQPWNRFFKVSGRNVNSQKCWIAILSFLPLENLRGIVRKAKSASGSKAVDF